MTKIQLIKAIQKQQKKLAKDRDDLQELLDEATDIVSSCEEADEFLTDAVSTLSQYL